MSDIKQIKIGNTPYGLKDETARLGKLDNSNVSTIQTTLTASKAYAINDPFIYEGQLYKADSAIAQGGTIVISGTGQNVSPTTIEELINLHGGGSGGHTILNSSGNAMTARGKLQFSNGSVTDNSANDKTVVDLVGTYSEGTQIVSTANQAFNVVISATGLSTSSKVLSVCTSVKGLNYTDITLASGTCTIAFPGVSSAQTVTAGIVWR